MSLNQWTEDADREAQRVVDQCREGIASMALQLFADLRTEARTVGGGFGSPVASGRFAASMRLSINSVDTSFEPPDPNYEYPSGSGARELPPRTIANTAISAASAALRNYKLGDTIYISNSVPYVRKIELGNHSWQTPDGVFGPTVREFLRKFSGVNVGISGG